MSIGLACRLDGTIQFCVKYENIYVTAKNDGSVPPSTVFKKIKIVESKNDSLAFIANIYDSVTDTIKSYYYRLHKNKDVNLGKLYDERTKELFFFKRYDVSTMIDTSSDGYNTTDRIVSGTYESIEFKLISTDNNIYRNIKANASFKLTSDAMFTVISDDCLEETYSIISDPIPFVAYANVIPIPYGIGYGLTDLSVTGMSNYDDKTGHCYMSVCSMPSIDTTTKTYKQLPLRLEDEYPGLANRSPIGIDYAIIGKTGFVYTGSALYSNSGLKLVANVDELYISEVGNMFFQHGLFFIAKSKLTNVYTFTELGMQLAYVIEDEIISTPSKITIGLIACGRNHIWLINQDGVRKIYSFNVTGGIIQGAIKTDVDNACVVVADGGDELYEKLAGNDETTSYIKGDDNFFIGCVSPILAVYSINQLGHVSSVSLGTSGVSDINFIDIGDTADLVIVDNTNLVLQLFAKAEASGSDTFSIESNQNVENYGASIEGELIKLKFFAMGTGNALFYFNGATSSPTTVAISSTGRYAEYTVEVGLTFSMFSYRIVIDDTVSILNRIIGYVNMKEVL
jgi:hypothetical protein